MSDVSFNPKTNWQLNETVNPEDANRWEQGIKDCADAIDDLNDFAEHTLGKLVGEIYHSQSTSAADNPGALPLFTGEVISSVNTLYPNFYAWLVAHPELQISQSGYEDSISTYGECPKYVLDTTNHTVRLAKISSPKRYLIKSFEDNNTWYRIYNDGFCEQGGTYEGNFVTGYVFNLLIPYTSTDYTVITNAIRNNNAPGCYGVREKTTTTFSGEAFRGGDGGITLSKLMWRATGYVDISGYVIPPLYPWVVAYTSAVPASTAQAAQFQAALSGKVNVADMEEVECVVESYHNGSSWYRVYSDGWCEQGGAVTITGNQTSQTVNLLKEFANVYYSVMLSSSDVSGTTVTGVELAWGFKTVNSFQFGRNEGYGGTQVVNWEARGYII